MTTGVLTQLVDRAILSESDDLQERKYIGASSIGSLCERAIWYRYNGHVPEALPAKQKRNFSIGKRLEGLVLDCIEQAGVKIARTWYDLKDAEIELFQGHIDAMWLAEDGSAKAILEVKTARDSSFNIFVNRGLKHWNPTYYSQIQSYMGMSGVHEAYLIALNKDTSDLHDERILFNAPFYEQLKRRCQRILDATEAPERINRNPMYFTCRGCQFKGACHS